MVMLPLKGNTGELLFHKLDSLTGFEVKARTAEITALDGSSVLKLDGMIVVAEQTFSDVRIEVEILVRESCYPGIAFRIADDNNFELAYAVPHASNQPDAIQYDPVFNRSNTWQLYNGQPYQRAAAIPTGKWFTLRIAIKGRRAAVWVAGQPPLIIENLAHLHTSGSVGLWTYKPAFFRNLRISTPGEIARGQGKPAQAPLGTITAWERQDGQILRCEPNGILNLNRYMQPSRQGVKVSRSFQLSGPSKVMIGVGFSDELTLFIDGKNIFQGSHLFKGFKDIPSRGWVSADHQKIELPLAAGTHKIEAELKVTEPFGWGLIITLNSPNLHLHPLKNPNT